MTEYGQLIQDRERALLEFRRHLNHRPNKVWRALTEDEQVAAWFPTTIDGDRSAGAELTFRFEQIEIDPMHGEILAFEPPSLLEFTWGGDRLRFELEADGDGTALRFEVELDVLGKATRDGAGWHQCLDSLELQLAGDPARPDDPDRWRSLRDSYAERFGPDASTLGPPQEWKEVHGNV
jgi:uncharacterized protein YndB with AHSA1/START domain